MLVLHLPESLGTAATPADFLLAWSFEPLILVPWLVLGGLYLLGSRRLARHRTRERPGDNHGPTFFLAGYVALGLALLSPIHGFGEELFLVHMTQHVLLMSVAAPLLLLANPLPNMLWSLPPGTRRGVGALLRPSGLVRQGLQFLTRPLIAWWLFVSSLWLWHLPAAYQSALEHAPLHYVQHLLFFATAVLFWWPVIGPAPLRSRLRYPARMGYVFATWLPNSALGAGITFAPAVLVPYYASRPRHWGIDALTDQQVAGLIMWIPGDLLYVVAMMVLLLAALRQEDRREARAAAALHL